MKQVCNISTINSTMRIPISQNKKLFLTRPSLIADVNSMRLCSKIWKLMTLMITRTVIIIRTVIITRTIIITHTVKITLTLLSTYKTISLNRLLYSLLSKWTMLCSKFIISGKLLGKTLNMLQVKFLQQLSKRKSQSKRMKLRLIIWTMPSTLPFNHLKNGAMPFRWILMRSGNKQDNLL